MYGSKSVRCTSRSMCLFDSFVVDGTARIEIKVDDKRTVAGALGSDRHAIDSSEHSKSLSISDFCHVSLRYDT